MRDGVRTLRVRVIAPQKADLVVVEADAQAHVVGAAVNGKRLSEEPLDEGIHYDPGTKRCGGACDNVVQWNGARSMEARLPSVLMRARQAQGRGARK